MSTNDRRSNRFTSGDCALTRSPRANRGRPPTLLANLTLALWLAFAWSPGDILAQQKADSLTVPKRDVMLDSLAKIIVTSVARHDSEHPVFHGCYDWHSAVHGHWAILRIANATGRHGEPAQAVADSLEPQKLTLEVEYLRKHPKFELPYGRAWLLRLAIEYETWAAGDDRRDAKRLQAIADECATSLLTSYRDRAPSPTTREYSNDSWALVQLHAYFSRRKQPEALASVEQLITKHFVSSEAPISFAQDHAAPDFFSRYGNLSYLLARTQEAAVVDTFVRRHPLGDDDLRAVDPLLPQAHHLGVNWSRAWALRALARQCTDESQRRRFEAAYLQHVATGWTHHEKYSANYGAYDHWVPQFAVYALTE